MSLTDSLSRLFLRCSIKLGRAADARGTAVTRQEWENRARNRTPAPPAGWDHMLVDRIIHTSAKDLIVRSGATDTSQSVHTIGDESTINECAIVFWKLRVGLLHSPASVCVSSHRGVLLLDEAAGVVFMPALPRLQLHAHAL